MPLARARCAACTLPLGDPPYATLVARCVRCGVAVQVAVAADGQPDGFDASFSPPRLQAWFAAAKVAMAQGHLGVAVGACARCAAPLVVPSRDPVALPCPHCQEPVRGAAADVLVDLWPEAWAKITGGSDVDLEYRLELVDAHSGLSAGCAACGQATPPNDPSMQCRRCGAVAWLARPPLAEGEPPQRVQLGVRVSGTRAKVPFKALVPIAQGEAWLRADALKGASVEGGRSLLGGFGLSCVAVLAVVTLLIVLIAVAVHFSKC